MFLIGYLAALAGAILLPGWYTFSGWVFDGIFSLFSGLLPVTTV